MRIISKQMDFLALVKRNEVEAVQKFLETSDDLAAINAQDQSGWTALHWAAHYGQTEIVQLLLTSPKFAETSINAQTKYGSTALHSAAINGNIAVVKLLLTSPRFVNGNLTNTFINAQSKSGLTALHKAAYHGKTEIIAHMLETEDFEAHLHVLQFDLDLINNQSKKAEDLTNNPEIKALFQKCRQAQNQLAYDLTKGAN